MPKGRVKPNQYYSHPACVPNIVEPATCHVMDWRWSSRLRKCTRRKHPNLCVIYDFEKDSYYGLADREVSAAGNVSGRQFQLWCFAYLPKRRWPLTRRVPHGRTGLSSELALGRAKPEVQHFGRPKRQWGTVLLTEDPLFRANRNPAANTTRNKA